MIEFIGLASLVYLFTSSSITEHFKSFFGVSNSDSTKSSFKHYIQELVNCSMCSGFYFFLAYYQNIFYAALGAIVSEILTRVITRL